MTVTLPVTLRSSSAVAVATTEYGVFEAARISSTTTATTSNKLTDSAGSFVTNAIAVGDVIKNTTTGKYALVTAVDSATALSVSADIFSSGDAYSIYPGTGYKLQQAWKELLVQLDVTAAATEVGDTLDVYVDMAIDDGTKWHNLIHFTQVVGNGGAKTFIACIKNDNPGASAVFATTSDAAAGATRQIGFGDRIRFRTVTVDATTTGNLSFTYSLKAFFK
ncbi:MAG: hypothetical protein AAB403_03735 [Planctomycetota bacterium]